MSLDVTRGGLLVTIAIFSVIVYEMRTVLDFVGIELPIIPYMSAVFVLAGLSLWIVSITGGWRTEPKDDESA